MTRRSVLLGVLAWACVVTVASAITWSVINAAGDQVLSGDDTMPALPAVSQAVQQSAGPPATGHRSRGSATPSPSTAAGPSPSAGRSRAAPQSTDGSWQGVGGVVSARCTGRSIALQSATPNDGYRVEVGSRGPAEVEVKFERATGHEMQLRAVCFQGAPSFREVSDIRDD